MKSSPSQPSRMPSSTGSPIPHSHLTLQEVLYERDPLRIGGKPATPIEYAVRGAHPPLGGRFQRNSRQRSPGTPGRKRRNNHFKDETIGGECSPQARG